jgi:hypothetical protein
MALATPLKELWSTGCRGQVTTICLGEGNYDSLKFEFLRSWYAYMFHHPAGSAYDLTHVVESTGAPILCTYPGAS